MPRHYVLLDANVPAAHFAPKSTGNRTLLARAAAMLSGATPNFDVQFLIPNFCIAEVFSVFEKYRWGRTWNTHVKPANTLTPTEFAGARAGFRLAIHNASGILQVELDRYHVLCVDLISPVNNAYKISRNRGGRKKQSRPGSTYDMLIAAMGIWLAQQHGRENFTIVTGDQRLADVLYRARSAALSQAIKAHLTGTAASLGLTYGPELYPEVLDLAHASKAELRARFPNWAPAW